MDYSKWALTRVDELERRFADLSSEVKTETIDSFEVLVENENEFVCGVSQKRIDFPAFTPTKNVTIIASVNCNYLFDATCSFSLYVDGELVCKQNKTANSGEDVNFVAVKKLAIYNAEPVSVWVSIETQGELALTILSYSLNVVGECKKLDSAREYGRFSADFFDANEKSDFVVAEPVLPQAEPETKQRFASIVGLGASVEFVVEKTPAYTNGIDIVCHTRIADYGEVVNVSGKFETEMQTFLANPQQYYCSIEHPTYSIEQQLPNQNEEDEPLPDSLKSGQKFALAYMEGNNIYLCQKGQGDSWQNATGQKIARGSKVAVAFDKLGTLMVARQTLDNKLYVASIDNLSAEIYIDEKVDEFDIVRAPLGSTYLFVVVYTKNNKLFAKYIAGMQVAFAEEIDAIDSCVSVRAARGYSDCLVLIASGKRNQIIVARPSPAASQKYYNCAASVLVF